MIFERNDQEVIPKGKLYEYTLLPARNAVYAIRGLHDFERIRDGTALYDKEELLTPRTGEKVLKEQLPAAILWVLREKDYCSFAQAELTYQMDNKKTILAMQGRDGMGTKVKIFEYNRDTFNEIQEIQESCCPVINLAGTSLAVIEKTYNVPYYVRGSRGGFEQQGKLTFTRPVSSIAFNDDGSRLTVNLIVSAKKYEEKEFVKNDAGLLEPVSSFQQWKDILLGEQL